MKSDTRGDGRGACPEFCDLSGGGAGTGGKGHRLHTCRSLLQGGGSGSGYGGTGGGNGGTLTNADGTGQADSTAQRRGDGP